MTAPSEAAMRAAIGEVAEAVGFGECVDTVAGLRDNLHSMAIAAAHPLAESGRVTMDGDGLWEPLMAPAPGCLWGDLRPSEAARLAELVWAAADRAAERCAAIIADELTAAGLAFAAEYPEAPRAAL